jgi:hypothetical protein
MDIPLDEIADNQSSLYHDRGLAAGDRRTVQIEQLHRFPEAERKFVLRQAVVQ